jgi:hypothetical protein
MKLDWERWSKPEGIWLRVQAHHEHGAITPTGLHEAMLYPVQEWSDQNKCGRRMSFDLWQFKNEKEVSMFLLKWS